MEKTCLEGCVLLSCTYKALGFVPHHCKNKTGKLFQNPKLEVMCLALPVEVACLLVLTMQYRKRGH